LALEFSGRTAASEPGGAAPSSPLRYNRDILPVLAEHCFPCHGPDASARKAKLRLDHEADALAPRRRGAPIVKGDPEKSLVVARITSSDPDEVMPPPESRKSLKPAQIELLRRWIAEGAPYERHWSFVAPERPRPPAVKGESWERSPLDRFVLAEIERVGLSPAPEAYRRPLARRASLDLNGLPPDPERVEEFVDDEAPDAYERFVDRVLACPQWGEHRARYWLDAARYADTHGIHFDNFRETWSYRDWVIHAFNQNLPFDEFTVEQLAGDLLPDRTVEQQIASGFNRCNITTNEGGAIEEEYLVLYTRDRTETAAQVWLGLTANCATCHDHKFDPLTQREFYEMAAFFNNTTQRGMDGNVKDTPPVITVPRPEDRERFEALGTELAAARARVDGRRKEARADFESWLASAAPSALGSGVLDAGLKLHVPLDDGEGSAVRVRADGSERSVASATPLAWDAGHTAARAYKSRKGAALEIEGVGDLDKDRPFAFGAWVKLPAAKLSGSLFARLDDRVGKGFPGWDLWLERGRPGTHLVHKWPEDAIKVVSAKPVEPGRWHHLFITYDGSGKAAGVEIYVNGARQEKNVQTDALKGSIHADVPLKLAQRHDGAPVEDVLLQDLRIYDRALSEEEVASIFRGTRSAWILRKPAAERSAEETDEVFARWLESADTGFREANQRLAALDEEKAALLARGTVAHVMSERSEAAMAYVLFRGEYDKRRDPVEAGTPDVLPPLPDDSPRNRLGFARWLMRPEHPLTARVNVNRFWQELFGTGIVRTAGDFGATGEPPSHPELLDWLAVELRESGWDVKRLFRALVTSAAYRQAAVSSPEKLQKDPQNRLVSRGPRFRMDAEMVRDGALAASGLLVPKLGGPSVKPYQPDGVWEAVAMPESNTRNYQRDSGEGLYRRSLYTFWKRAAPPAAMDIFNAPNRETCTVRRERTNTPLQALVTLNDTQMVEAARVLAQAALRAEAPEKDRSLDWMARRVLSRPLRADEMDVLRGARDDLLAYYRSNAADAAALLAAGESKADPALDPAELAAHTMVANQLLNLDETLNK
jgi:mono/diheme cytochrome c family protein